MEEVIYNHLISLGFEEISTLFFKKNDITIVYAEDSYHFSFYLEPRGDITLVHKVDKNRMSDFQINNFIDCVNYIKNKL
jgi:hypothetical protein